jgi:hypothetical protein
LATCPTNGVVFQENSEPSAAQRRMAYDDVWGRYALGGKKGTGPVCRTAA